MRDKNLRRGLWLIGVVVLSLWTVFGWSRIPSGQRFLAPNSPLDNTPGLNARQWAFLWQVHEVLPEDASYTIEATTPGEEMDLFMMSLGILTSQTPHPATYYMRTTNGDELNARYVLSFDCTVVPLDTSVVARLDDGCICEREVE